MSKLSERQIAAIRQRENNREAKIIKMMTRNPEWSRPYAEGWHDGAADGWWDRIHPVAEKDDTEYGEAYRKERIRSLDLAKKDRVFAPESVNRGNATVSLWFCERCGQHVGSTSEAPPPHLCIPLDELPELPAEKEELVAGGEPSEWEKAMIRILEKCEAHMHEQVVWTARCLNSITLLAGAYQGFCDRLYELWHQPPVVEPPPTNKEKS